MIKWVLTEEQKATVKKHVQENYEDWCNDGKFCADSCADDLITHFGFTTHEEACDCQGLAEEVENDKWEAEAYYWGVELGFIKVAK